MTLHLTRDEWDRIAGDGGGVLFRSEEPLDAARYATFQTSEPPGPPAEFVEAAKPCETCEGRGIRYVDRFGQVYGNRLADELNLTLTIPCPDCLNGKRRITVTVPCEHPDHENVKGGMWLCAIDGPPHTDDGLVTVGHAVVEWGPLVVRGDGRGGPWPGPHVEIIGSGAWVWMSTDSGDCTEISATLPPDIDPQTLVGQYAIGIKVVEL